MYICKQFVDKVADAIFNVLVNADAPFKKQTSLAQCSYFLATTMLQNFLPLPTLLKAVPGFQYILNIITVADSANADADTTLLTRTQNSRIRTSLVCTLVYSAHEMMLV